MNDEVVTYETGSATDRGRVRTENQDSVCVRLVACGRLLALADGMGGHLGGATASALAIDAAASVVEQQCREHMEPEEVRALLVESFLAANRRVRREASARPELRGMGTTLLMVLQVGEDVYFAHVGDTRLYSVTREGVLQLTHDHTSVQVLRDSGVLTEEEAARHPDAHRLLQSIGHTEEVTPEVCSEPLVLAPGQLLLLCSDGVYNSVPPAEFSKLLSKPTSLIAKELVTLANQAGGEDNSSALVLRRAPSRQKKPKASGAPEVEPPPQVETQEQETGLLARWFASERWRKAKGYLLGAAGGVATSLLLMLILHLCTTDWEEERSAPSNPAALPSQKAEQPAELPGPTSPGEPSAHQQGPQESPQAPTARKTATRQVAEADASSQDVVAESDAGSVAMQGETVPATQAAKKPVPEVPQLPPCKLEPGMDAGTVTQVTEYLSKRTQVSEMLSHANWTRLKEVLPALETLAASMPSPTKERCAADYRALLGTVSERLTRFAAGRYKRKGCKSACKDLLWCKRNLPAQTQPVRSALESELGAECVELCVKQGLEFAREEPTEVGEPESPAQPAPVPEVAPAPEGATGAPKGTSPTPEAAPTVVPLPISPPVPMKPETAPPGSL